MEKAVVASNVGWGTELINHGIDGLLAHPTIHGQFALHIIELLNNPDLNGQMGKNARKKTINNFDNKVIAQQSLKYYNTIISNA